MLQVLRALAVFGASNELLSAILAATLLGFCIMSLVAAFRPSSDFAAQTGRMVLTIVIITGVVLVPARVVLSDHFDGQDLLWTSGAATGDVVVSNVPLGVALPAALASALGVSLTRIIETSLGLGDAQDRLSAAGLWLSARALRAMIGKTSPADSTLAGDFRYFLENCTQFDVLAERVSLVGLRSGRALSELALTSGGLTSVHAGAGGSKPIAVSCTEAWNGRDEPALTGLASRIATEGQVKKFQACQQLRGIALALSSAERDEQRAAARTPTLGSAASCGDTVFENALRTFGFVDTVGNQFSEIVALELLQDGAYALSNQDPRSLGLATFVAQRQRNASYVIAGELAAAVLPALRGALEAVVLMLMPLLLVMGMLFFDRLGQYLRNGLVLMVWLHMWPPVMAVVNGVGQWVQRAAINEHVILGDGRITLAGAAELLNELDTQLAISRYMLVLVPMIAWALVRSGEMGASLLAARLLQPGEQAAAASASQAATNNWTLDQVQMQPRTSVGPHMATIGDSWGGTVTRYDQMQTMSLPSNQPGYIAATSAAAIRSALTQRAEQSKAHAQEQRTMLSESVENAYENTFGSHGAEALRTLQEQGVENSTALRALQSSSELWRQTTGKKRAVDQSETTDHAWHADVEGTIGARAFFMLPLGGTASFRTGQRNSAELSESMSRSYDMLDEESRSAIKEVGEALQHMDKTTAGTSFTKINSEEHKAMMREASRDMEIYSDSMQRSEKLARASEQAASRAQEVVHELARDPANANLLTELHQLQNVLGMPFEQAWPLAQERSGVKLGIDAVAERLISSEIAPMPAKERALGGEIEAFAQNRERVEKSQQGAPTEPAETISKTKSEIEQRHDAQSSSQPPPVGKDFYDDRRAMDKTIYDENGKVEMVVPDGSLYRASDRRFSENLSDAAGDGLDFLTGNNEKKDDSEAD